MRQGKVYYNDLLAGIITEDENGYSFLYEETYLLSDQPQPVSLTLPLQREPFHSNVLFSFFDGLIPKVWMLNIAERNWKINRRDRMALLLACCRDCIGNVSILPVKQEERL